MNESQKQALRLLQRQAQDLYQHTEVDTQLDELTLIVVNMLDLLEDVLQR